MNQLEHAAAQTLGRQHAQQTLDRRTIEQDAAVRVDEGNEIDRVFENRPVTLVGSRPRPRRAFKR